MLRGELKLIYDMLENVEKHQWAKECDYKSREGLYSYLRVKPDKIAYKKLVNSLIRVIGADSFDKYVQDIRSNKKLDIEDIKRDLIKVILSSNDKNVIEDIKMDILAACNSQLLRMQVENSINAVK